MEKIFYPSDKDYKDLEDNIPGIVTHPLDEDVEYPYYPYPGYPYNPIWLWDPNKGPQWVSLENNTSTNIIFRS